MESHRDEKESLLGRPEMPSRNDVAQESRSHLQEDVLSHLTKSAVQSVSSAMGVDISEDSSKNVTSWIVRAAKSVPLFTPAGGTLRRFSYGAAAVLYGASEAKWGDSAENLTKDALLGGLKGIGIKGSMDLIGTRMQTAALEGRAWSAPAMGVTFGLASTSVDSALSRATYCDETGTYRGLQYGLRNTVMAVSNLETVAMGAATFTMGAAGMKALQASPLATIYPGLMRNAVLHNVSTAFSFGAFSGMSEEARQQVKLGGFNAWEVSKFDFARIAKQGLFAATSDAAGAVFGAKLAARPAPVEATQLREQRLIGSRPATIESVQRIDHPSNQTITDHSHLQRLVEAPLVSSVTNLWDKNIRTVASGVYHTKPQEYSGWGTPIHIGEYQPPYYQVTVGTDGRYHPVDPVREHPSTIGENPGSKGLRAYIVLDELSLSPENQRIARELGHIRTPSYDIELSIPVEPGTPAKQLEAAMLELARRFGPQPLMWGYQTPIQFFRERMNTEYGVPTREWMAETVSSADFKQRGLVYDPLSDLIFASAELANKYKAAPPPEPTWYRGPETFGKLSRGGWRQAYNMAAVHLYSPSGHGMEPPNPKTARIPDRNFELSDLANPEHAQYYLADKQRFFELFGTKAYDTLADRHWLELRNKAFESVEQHWPMASVEKDRALGLGTMLLARACAGNGHFGLQDAGLMYVLIPPHLWREPSGRRLSPPEVIDMTNRIYDDMVVATRTPFDHTFGKEVLERTTAPGGDRSVDKYQFTRNQARSLEKLLTVGWQMHVHPKYVPLMQEIMRKQSEGLIPERFDQSTGKDGLVTYTPVYRQATFEETKLPLSELTKNLKIIDYGFKNRNGPVLGKVSLASHDVHDHARAFWLLEKEGLFDGKNGLPGYQQLMGKLTDPTHTDVFKREGELVASVAYDARNFYDSHPDYDPPVNLKDVRAYFLHADRQGIPLSVNQTRALSYLEELLQKDPDGKQPESRKLRHILGGVWLETLEQKRKTDTTLWQRSDGTYQRMSPTNPEYLAFVIDAARIVEQNAEAMRNALMHNNLKMEQYLRDVAGSTNGATVPKLHFTPEDITTGTPLRSTVPEQTQYWMMRHPGFNTRRAPIRDWLLGYQSEWDAAEALQAQMEARRREFYQSSEWRDFLYGGRD